ncbi:hypothetical protein DPMN_060072 [Dreissena polymorpha]|uniref:Uncharacterized protein n=1 Tax=Dreissena polymorpha TaxID=45954 RepID=A0A9D4HH60_DREPO|nr:hypothetical protein DPMN_060072 [Dreissena polymorpha]
MCLFLHHYSETSSNNNYLPVALVTVDEYEEIRFHSVYVYVVRVIGKSCADAITALVTQANTWHDATNCPNGAGEKCLYTVCLKKSNILNERSQSYIMLPYPPCVDPPLLN